VHYLKKASHEKTLRVVQKMEMKQIRCHMSKNLNRALNVWGSLDENRRDMVREKVQAWNSIKSEIDQKARDLGYSCACMESIPMCKGECCKRHFPVEFDPTDFLMTISGLSQKDRESLLNQIMVSGDNKYKCPILLENGCFLSFETRPMACTNAFPCFMEREYWEYKEIKKNQAKAIYKSIGTLFENECA